MVARFAWFDEGGQTWSETQDIVVYPGCNRMTIDLATNPAVAVNDESTVYKAGWRGMRISAPALRPQRGPGCARLLAERDPPGRRRRVLRRDVPDHVQLERRRHRRHLRHDDSGQLERHQGRHGIPVSAGTNTFNWDGSGMPNGTYWVYTTVHSGNTVGSAYSTGPVRIERPVPSTPSCFVPLNPARLLDTRDGTGGNISALSSQALTELRVTGVGGVPPTGATAVVLNVTVDAPITSGFITAWPSGEGQPTVSNLNYVAGQTVPNLVTVKVGANGRVNLYNSEGYTHLVADVVGYYTAAATPAVPGGSRRHSETLARHPSGRRYASRSRAGDQPRGDRRRDDRPGLAPAVSP